MCCICIFICIFRIYIYTLLNPTFTHPHILPNTITYSTDAAAARRYDPATQAPPQPREGMLEKKTGRETVGGGWEARYFVIKHPVSFGGCYDIECLMDGCTTPTPITH